jgi:benzodiazapine receptor
MTRSQAVVGAGVVLVVLAYAGLAGAWVSRDPGWYATLPKPSWQPPDLVFGIIWPYNFLALLVAGLVLTGSRPTRTAAAWLAVLVVTAAFALAWAYLFYVPHALMAAAVCLGGSAVAAWVLVLLAGREIPWLTVVLVPYAIWVSVATALAVDYSRA